MFIGKGYESAAKLPHSKLVTLCLCNIFYMSLIGTLSSAYQIMLHKHEGVDETTGFNVSGDLVSFLKDVRSLFNICKRMK
mmetsp:Transcript_60369/g.178771  ORF Transcript_60369/g.178771 Transcript_60369/m.178771 type:complete len:80 (-) Transcript_60369:73-312(-)